MTDILKGKAVADRIKEELAGRIEILNKKGKAPKLTIVRVGEKPNDISYENSLKKNCEKMNILSEVVELSEDITTESLIAEIEKLNQDEQVSAVLMFRPLPKHIDEERVANSLSPEKDVDCMTSVNLEKIFKGDFSGFSPCTPKAAMEILTFYGVELSGKEVVVVNRSMVLGKPLAMMLLDKNATVTICHSKTKDLPEVTKRADVVVTALGRAKMITEDYLGSHSICIDVGVSPDKDGNLSGDLDYENLVQHVDKITPVPGGVGSVTTTILLEQVVKAAELQG